jgi:hypothetical protein
MCYSKESSLYTSTVSFVAIVYLLSSGIPHFQWMGFTLIGWSAMQFAEYLLWSEKPQEGCTETNKAITATLIPISLALQPLAPAFGALFVYPLEMLLPYLILWVFLVVGVMVLYYLQLHDPEQPCTFVNKEGNLDWSRAKDYTDDMSKAFYYITWVTLIGIPMFFGWKKSYRFLAAFWILPTVGYVYGLSRLSSGSIWCYYTSWTSIVAALGLLLKQTGTYDVLRA